MERNSVPLVMLPHNISAMLKAHDEGRIIPCHGVSFKRDPESANGVILMFQMSEADRQIAEEEFGFKAQQKEKQ